ncbi:MAG: hypothetical protein CME62_07035 [Halobacteriovoraceae bacterium]|nr:hypothetical protein [Halobacteriovoraceae bacterium]
MNAHAPQLKIKLDVSTSQEKQKKLLSKIIMDEKNEFILGRSAEEADIVVQDPNASRKHIKILMKNNKLWFEDLKTKNGTFLNGEKSDKAYLTQGDVLSLGEHIITVSLVEPIEQAPQSLDIEAQKDEDNLKIIRNHSSSI